MMSPLIRPPDGPLQRALHTLDGGERWLVEPQQLDSEGRLWSPGVRLGVAEGSWFHRTECFGPVLGVMRARDLDHAIELQNAVDFGLTGGIHSLDPHEVDRWLEVDGVLEIDGVVEVAGPHHAEHGPETLGAMEPRAFGNTEAHTR